MRERSLSPPPARGKRKSPPPAAPPAPLTTPYTAEQMNSAPEAEGKKDFLLLFDLSHVSPQQRRGTSSPIHCQHLSLISTYLPHRT